jgi:hypothetical protein
VVVAATAAIAIDAFSAPDPSNEAQ